MSKRCECRVPIGWMRFETQSGNCGDCGRPLVQSRPGDWGAKVVAVITGIRRLVRAYDLLTDTQSPSSALVAEQLHALTGQLLALENLREGADQ